MENETIKWDYKIGDKVEYFDPTKSYELTGYRPIDEFNGLDFDPDPFMETVFFKEKYGVHVFAPPKTPLYNEFWTREVDRCKNGLTINGYRITGHHYFFLNFYKLLIANETDKTSQGRDMSHPNFWAKHYEYFHYIELCQYLQKDVCALKARGVGFSEIAASLGACMYTIYKKSKTMYIASQESFLLENGVIQKVWDVLEILNQDTEGALRHPSMKKKEPLWRRSSLVDKQGQELKDSFLSEIFGKVVTNPRKVRGVRLELLLFEESGSFPRLVTMYNQSEALIYLQGKKIGTRILWGTGGDSGEQLAGLEEIFRNPTNFNILPYLNNHNEQGEWVLTGMFIPAFSCMPQYMDHRGVTNEEKSKKYHNDLRALKVSTPKNWLEYCSEYCFYPEEALSRQGQNDFDQNKIAEQISNIKVMKELPKTYKRGSLHWNYKDNTDEIIGVRFIENSNGPIIVMEEPQTDELNKPLDNLYVAGIDSIDHAEGDSVVGKDGSKFAITVKKRIFGNQGNMYVCMYMERPQDIRTAYENAAKILFWYGCKANLEDTKIGFRLWLQEKKMLYKMLMKRPLAALSSNRRSSNLWGTPGSEKMIRHGLELITQYVNDDCHQIWFIEMLEQLQKFSYEAKGRFDIVMSMVYTEIADEDMMGITVRKEDSIQSQWEEYGDIVWTRNDKGYMELGYSKQQQ